MIFWFDFRGQKHKSALSVTIDYHFLVWQIHETFPILYANFFYKNRHFSQGTKFISCVYRRSTKSSYRLLSTTNLPKVYQKKWFFMILESCCNSVFFNFWYSKSSKNRAQKGQKTTKEIKTLHRFKNLKSLGVTSVPVQVRLAAPPGAVHLDRIPLSLCDNGIFCIIAKNQLNNL